MKIRKLLSIISVLFVFGQMATFAQEEGALDYSNASVSIKYYNRTVYYPGSADEAPILVHITIKNNGAETLRFKLADDRSFSMDFNAYNDEKAACNYLLQTTYSLQDRMLSACRYAINTGASSVKAKHAIDGKVATVSVPATKDLLYEGGGPNWNGRVPAFDGKIFRWGAGSEYGSWLFRVYEYFEYTNKIAGIGFVHIIYQPFTAEETLLCRAEAKLYLGNREGAIQYLEAWTASKIIDEPLTQAQINKKYAGTPATNIFVNDMHPDKMSSEFKVLTGEDLNVLNCILHFRRIETMFEGMRWFDIKRYGITVTHVYRDPMDYDATYDVLEWNDPRRIVQIPYNAIDAGYPSTDRAFDRNNSGDSRWKSYSVAQ